MAEEKNEEAEKHVDIWVEIKADGESTFHAMSYTDSFDDLKEKIEALQGIPAHQQRFVFDGKLLWEGTWQEIKEKAEESGAYGTVRVPLVLELTGGGGNHITVDTGSLLF